MGRVIVICGKIGSGKPIYARKLATKLNAVIITQDEPINEIFGANFYHADREGYRKYVTQVEKYVKRKAGEAAKAGAVAVIENGFLYRAERNELRKFYNEMDIAYELHYMDTLEKHRIANINLVI